MKGIVSALGMSNQAGSGILAAGTFTRMIGLYDSEGSGDSIAVFSIAPPGEGSNRTGAGITALEWSPCERYLYVAERKSTEILVYDVRVASRQLKSLAGRIASSNQRLGIHVVPANQRHEVWAGCDDGIVRIWRYAWEDSEAPKQPDWAWKAHDGMVPPQIVFIPFHNYF
jgi:WD40 repeat protein